MIDQLKRRHWTIDDIVALLEKYPNGIAAKYAKRLRKEVARSYGKAVGGAPAIAPSGTPGTAGTGLSGGVAPAAAAPQAAGPGPGAAPSAARAPHILPTIRLVDGQLPRTVEATERAMLAANLDIFSRAGELVYPVSESRPAANGRKTITARLSAFRPDAFIEPAPECLDRHRPASPIGAYGVVA